MSGFAVGFKNICFSEGFDDYCAARVRLFEDGSAEVHCAAAEVGQGVSNVILQVARTELGTDDVRLAPHSTATRRLRRLDVRLAADVDGLRRRPGRVPRRARRARGTGGGEVDVERIYRHAPTTPLDPETGQITGERAHVAFARLRDAVVAEVDVELGLTRVVWIGAAQDIGKAIDPRSVEGQIEGGIAQGLGLALMEEIQTRDGKITNASFTDYLIPTALDMPPVETVLIEDPGAGRAVRREGRRRAADRGRDRRGRRGARATGRDRVPVRPDDIVGSARAGRRPADARVRVGV